MYKETKRRINHYLNEGVFPGASFAFVRGTTSEKSTVGFAQLVPQKEAMTPELLFDVASLTKVVCTTTVILQLVEEGRVAIDAPVASYFPAFRDSRLTIRHLLTHTGDINTYIPNRDRLTQKQLIQAYTQVRSGDRLGKESRYTDAGTIILGLMIEELLGQPATEVFAQRVLAPLDMPTSCFMPQNPLETVPTEVHPARGLIRGQVHDPKAFVLGSHAGNAGLFTNLKELLHFVHMYLNSGMYHGNQVLRQDTITGLLQDHSFAHNHQRSLGWDLKWKAAGAPPYLFHTGYTGTFILMDIPAKEAFVFLSNRVHPIDKREAYIEKRDQLLQLYLREKDG